VINLEHLQRAEQVRAPPRERVEPRAQDDVLREGASSQPILGIAAASADVARILFFVFVVAFAVLLILALTATRRV